MGVQFFGKIGIVWYLLLLIVPLAAALLLGLAVAARKGMSFRAKVPVRLVGLIGVAILVGTVMSMSDRESGAVAGGVTFDQLVQQAERQKEFCRTIAGLANPTYEQLAESVRRGCPD
jgi:hypothetical protein